MKIMKSMMRDLKEQWSTILLLSLWLYIPVAVFLVVVAIVALKGNIPIGLFMSDPTTWTQVPFYTGIVSNVGILLMTSACAILLFGFFLIKDSSGLVSERRMFLVFGLYTLYLTLDDFFLIHEDILKRGIGIPEEITFPTYFLILAVCILVFSKKLLRSNYWIFILALVLLALSVVLDLSEPILRDLIDDLPVKYFEEGFKLAGLATWAFYFWKLVLDTIKLNILPNQGNVH